MRDQALSALLPSPSETPETRHRFKLHAGFEPAVPRIRNRVLSFRANAEQELLFVSFFLPGLRADIPLFQVPNVSAPPPEDRSPASARFFAPRY